MTQRSSLNPCSGGSALPTWPEHGVPASPEAGESDHACIDASQYPYAHLVRGTLLAELGRTEEARASLREAHHVARNAAEAEQIAAEIARLEEKR